MMLSIINAKYLNDYKLSIEFSDGRSGIVDLETKIKSFKPYYSLIDKNIFSKFEVDYTIRWSNELDIAPEYLYFKAFENDKNLKPLFDEWGYVA
jgi:hypothetical protein